MSNRIEWLSNMQREVPQDPFYPYAIALEIHSKTGNRSVSLQLLREVIIKFPEYIPAYHLLATWLVEDGNQDEATKVLKEGIGLALASGGVKAASEMKSLLAELEF